MGPLDIRTELFYDGQWNDISEDVRATEDMSITRGIPDEAVTADPASLSFKLNNRHGKYSPKNPRSPLYGKLGINTPVRVRIGEIPPTPDAVFYDTFPGAVLDGWGTSDSGHPYTVTAFGKFPTTNASRFTILSGHGYIASTSVLDENFIFSSYAPQDFDISYQVVVDKETLGTSRNNSLMSVLVFRANPGAGTGYGLTVRFGADTGRPDDTGRRVFANFVRYLNVGNGNTGDDFQESYWTAVSGFQTIPDLVYATDIPVNVRLRVEGGRFKAKIWDSRVSEPDYWQLFVTDFAIAGAGNIGFGARADHGALTNYPQRVGFRNVSARPVSPPNYNVRGVYEISEWPVSWDLSGNDTWVPVKASGVLRRFNQNTSQYSAISKHISSQYPVAYWPLEEGSPQLESGGTYTVSNSTVPNTPDLRTSGLSWGQNSNLPGSLPLPTLTDAGHIWSPATQSKPQGSWSVGMLVYIPRDSIPTGTSGHTLLQFSSNGTARHWHLTLQEDSGSMRFNALVTTDEGATLASTSLRPSAWGTYDTWVEVRMGATQAGADVQLWFTLQPIIPEGIFRRVGWYTSITWAGDVGTYRSINTRFSPALAGSTIGHISVWGMTNVLPILGGNPGDNPAWGFSGEGPRARIERTAMHFYTPTWYEGTPRPIPMGPQTVGTGLQHIKEAANVDMGMLKEDRESLSLIVKGVSEFLNMEPKLTLDYANGEVSPPFNPTYDDQGFANSVTASQKANGGSFTAEITEGPLSTQDFPEGRSRYSVDIETNVANSTSLGSLAYWALHHRGTDKVRYPSVTVNLMNPRMEPLIDLIMSLSEGDKIAIDNLPETLPESYTELIIKSYTEVLNKFQWTITFNCESADGYTVGSVGENDPEEDAWPSRVDTENAYLYSSVDSEQTEAVVYTEHGPTWVTSDGISPSAEDGDLPFTMQMGSEKVLATDITPYDWDMFNRTVSNGWGSTALGASWAQSGGDASEISVNGSQAVITLPSSGDRYMLFPSEFSDYEALLTVMPGQVSTGGPISGGFAARVSGPNSIDVRLQFDTNGTCTIGILWNGSEIGSQVVTHYTYDDTSVFYLRVKVQGLTVNARVWGEKEFSPIIEPPYWTISRDIPASFATSGFIGINAGRDPSNTNVNPTVSYDNFVILNPQRVTMERGVDGFSGPQSAGDTVSLAYPAYVSL